MRRPTSLRRAGADTLSALAGDDVLYAESADDVTVDATGGSDDLVRNRVSYTLWAGVHVETLATETGITGTAAINLSGNALHQSIFGSAGDNVLIGAGGTDLLSGFGGSDTVSFTTALGADSIGRITGFSAAVDTVRLAGTVFSALDPHMFSTTAYKEIGDPGAVVDADDRILYDHGTWTLH